MYITPRKITKTSVKHSCTRSPYSPFDNATSLKSPCFKKTKRSLSETLNTVPDEHNETDINCCLLQNIDELTLLTSEPINDNNDFYFGTFLSNIDSTLTDEGGTLLQCIDTNVNTSKELDHQESEPLDDFEFHALKSQLTNDVSKKSRYLNETSVTLMK